MFVVELDPFQIKNSYYKSHFKLIIKLRGNRLVQNIMEGSQSGSTSDGSSNTEDLTSENKEKTSR